MVASFVFLFQSGEKPFRGYLNLNMKSDKFDPTKDLSTGGSMPMQYPMMGQMH